MKKIINVVSIVLSIVFVNSTFANTTNDSMVKFDSGEHSYIGNAATIYFPANNKKPTDITGDKVDFRSSLKLKAKSQITFGKVVAIPDFFASTNSVCNGKTFEERKKLFIESYDVFAKAKIQNINGIYTVMDDEIAMLNDAIKHGRTPSEEYKKAGQTYNARYIAAYPAQINLLTTNVDHFGQGAWLTYEAGHALAIADAVKANKNHDLYYLALAYAKEAYADHFLSDHFAGGHLRTPRKDLAQLAIKESISSTTTGLFSMYMHNEDNEQPLALTNKRGNKWLAYGDMFYLDKVNSDNKKMVDEAIQVSANEIKQAYLTGKEIPIENYAARELVPNLTALTDYIHYVDSKSKTIPLFYYDKAKDNMLRRSEINKMHPDNTPVTSNVMVQYGGLTGWWAWTTLIELLTYYHPSANLNLQRNMRNYVTLDGNLTDTGAQVLASLMNDYEKLAYCVDKQTDKKLLKYLPCDELFTKQ